MQAALFDAEPDDPADDAPPARAGKPRAKPAPQGPPAKPGVAEPVTFGASLVERWAARATLVAELEGYAAGTTAADELFRVLRGVLYVFSADELVGIGRVVLGVMQAAEVRHNQGDAA